MLLGESTVVTVGIERRRFMRRQVDLLGTQGCITVLDPVRCHVFRLHEYFQ